MRLDRQAALRLGLSLALMGIVGMPVAVAAPGHAVEEKAVAECAPPGWEQTRLELVEGTLARWRASLRSTYGSEASSREAQLRDALSSVRVGRLRMAAAATTFEQLAQALEGAAAEAEVDRVRAKRADCDEVTLKDGTGTGANSWIGYVFGSNQATGSGSAVTAGTFNLASGQGSFVGAGQSNRASGISSLVIGGFDNRATAIDSLVGGGAGHRATGARSVIVGGGYNLASGQFSFIGGGGRDGTASTAAGTDARDHIASGNFSTIGGGQGHRAGPGSWSTVAGGNSNTAAGIRSTVAGGQGNTASGDNSTVAGGLLNSASEHSSTVAGGQTNTASGFFSAAAGGEFNTASGNSSAIAGGQSNAASGNWSVVAGGHTNTASGDDSAVGGGESNTASGTYSTVGGGLGNLASGYASTVGGGVFNTASGSASTVAGGSNNFATGNFSFAAGVRAMTQTAGPTPTIHHGTFVFADNTALDFHTAATNEFAVRATGGARFVTAVDGAGNPTRTARITPNSELDFGAQTRQMLNLWGTPGVGGNYGIGVQSSTLYMRSGDHFAWFVGGVHNDAALTPGLGGVTLMTLTNGASSSIVLGTLRAAVITATSDRAQKTGFAPVDGAAVLARVAALPIATWEYRHMPGVRHLGPMGQDFSAAFGLGFDDTSIATVDADGVALAAIQGLNAKLEQQLAERDRTIAVQARELEAQRADIAELRKVVEALVARTAGGERIAAVR